MLIHLPKSARIASLTAALMLTASPALALEGKALLEKLMASGAFEKTKWEWGSVTESGSDTFTLQNVVITGKSGEKSNVDTVAFKAFKETAGRLTYDSIAFSNLNGTTKKGGRVAIAGVVTTDGDIPLDIWAGGLSAVEKKERIKIGSFSFNGIAVDEEDSQVQMDSVALVNADIPLDFRFDPDQQYEGDPAAPLTFDTFSMTGLSGTQKMKDAAGGTSSGKANVTWQMASMSLNSVSFPTSLNATIDEWMKIYSSLSVNDVKASMGDTEVFAMKQFGGTISPPDANGDSKSTSTMEGLFINLKAIPDPKAQEVIQKLGYDRVDADMSGVGTYNFNTGRAALEDMVLTMKDMFDFRMDYAITGYTPEVAKAIMEAQLQGAKSGNPSAGFMAIMPQLANIKLESLKISLTDHSLTGKLLDLQGQQMGTTGDQLAAGAPMMIGLGMAQLQMPEFTEMVSAAIGKFLKDKGTLSVEAAPSEPVPIMNVVISGQADPKQVPKMLGLKISAE